MSRPKILFVDDEPNVLMSFRMVFRREPYVVLTAGSAKEALEVLAQQPVAVLVTDYRMPGMTGIQLLREARRLHGGVFRVLASGHVDQEEFLETLADGDVQRMIQKPWDVDDLQAALREILESQGALEGQAQE